MHSGVFDRVMADLTSPESFDLVQVPCCSACVDFLCFEKYCGV